MFFKKSLKSDFAKINKKNKLKTAKNQM